MFSARWRGTSGAAHSTDASSRTLSGGAAARRDHARAGRDARRGRFTLARYSLDGTLEQYLGTTKTGAVVPLSDAPGARFVEWAPAGNSLLNRYLDRIELRDLDGARRTVSLAGPPGTVHTWMPDGKTAVLGTVSPTIPAGETFDVFSVWNAQLGTKAATGVTLPNLLGERKLSPDGKYFVGVSRTGPHTTRLEVYRCSSTPATAPADPDMAARLAKIDASPDRLVRPAAGEITQFLTAVEWVAVGGNRVCVTHAQSVESCYFHTGAPLVSVGQRVVRGQHVALIGMTGVTTGPHTHWEVKQAGRIVDPLMR